ncbi:MAG: cation transporter [Candidatus Woesebacteria bacterium]|nr:cation transporter [Candidatus Woesebacteria bacterium]
MPNKIYKITGMNCPSCASMLELDLKDVGVKAKCSYSKSTVEVEGDGNFVKIKKVVEKSGYQIN